MTDVKTAPQQKNPIVKSSAVSVDIPVVTNTHYVVDWCEKNNIHPSQDPNNPTGIVTSSGMQGLL